MARGRLISKSLGSSRRFHALLRAGGKLGEFCQVLFPLIVANTDDFGRMPGDAFTVKNLVLPSSKRLERDFDAALDVMADVGLVARYHVDGSVYLQVEQFDEHQPNLHKRTISRFPEYPGASEDYRANLIELKRTQSKRTQNTTEPRQEAQREADRLFECFWTAFPKKRSKDEARKAWDKRRPTEALLNAIVTAITEQSQSDDWRKENGRYIPYPATWLNRGQWTDSVMPALEAPFSAAELAHAKKVRSGRFGCQHDPRCQSVEACVEATALEIRLKAKAS